VDIIIRNGMIYERGEVMDLGIMDGKIVHLASHIKEKAREEIYATGCIVAPGFVDPHVHMDKCLTMDRARNEGEVRTLADMIRVQRRMKKAFTVEDVKARAIAVARMAVANGTTSTRTYVEADPIVEYRAVEGVLAAKEACRAILDIQTIAFPQEGWLANADDWELESKPFVIHAMELGLDAVGGNVNRAVWDSDPEKQVDDLFECARKHDADIAMHLDNAYNAVAFTLPYVAKKAMECGYQGRVSVDHIVSLALVPDRVAHQAIDLVREARLNVCVLPTVIRLTRVAELMEAGVNVMLGTDNLRDGFTHIGHGDADMLKSMLLLSQVLNFGFEDEMERVFQAGTYNAAKGMRIAEGYGIAEGNRADIVVLEAASINDAISRIARRRAVVKGGRLVAQNGTLQA